MIYLVISIFCNCCSCTESGTVSFRPKDSPQTESMPTSLLNSFAWPIDPEASVTGGLQVSACTHVYTYFLPTRRGNSWSIFPLSFIPPFGQSRHNIWKTVHTNTGRALMIGSSQQKHNNLRFLLRGYFTQKGNLIWIFRFKSHFVLASTNQEVYQCMFMINTWWKRYSISLH